MGGGRVIPILRERVAEELNNNQQKTKKKEKKTHRGGGCFGGGVVGVWFVFFFWGKSRAPEKRGGVKNGKIESHFPFFWGGELLGNNEGGEGCRGEEENSSGSRTLCRGPSPRRKEEGPTIWRGKWGKKTQKKKKKKKKKQHSGRIGTKKHKENQKKPSVHHLRAKLPSFGGYTPPASTEWEKNTNREKKKFA